MFLTSCATYPKTYQNEKQYHDEFVNKSCDWIKEKQITDKKQINIIERGEKYTKGDIKALAICEIIAVPFAIVFPPFIGICMASPSDPRLYEYEDNLKIELRMLKKVAKEKHCPQEINYEIITDSSHAMHFPH